MVVKTRNNLAPKPNTVSSKVYAVYETLEALGGEASIHDLRTLLPAAHDGIDCTVSDHKFYDTLYKIAVSSGYAETYFRMDNVRKKDMNGKHAKYKFAFFKIGSIDHFNIRIASRDIANAKQKSKHLARKHEARAEQLDSLKAVEDFFKEETPPVAVHRAKVPSPTKQVELPFAPEKPSPIVTAEPINYTYLSLAIALGVFVGIFPIFLAVIGGWRG